VEEELTRPGEKRREVGVEWKSVVANDATVWRYLDKLLRGKLSLKELEVVKQFSFDPTFEDERERLENVCEKYRETAGETDK
jgi:hypothetical protein